MEYLQKTTQEQGNPGDSEDSEFLLDEYDSDDTGNTDGRKKPLMAKTESNSNLSADVQELLRRYVYEDQEKP
jgi:hypothetical protein